MKKADPAASAGAKRRAFRVSSVDLAAIFGVHENTVGNWIKAGLPHNRAKGARSHSIDVGEAIRWVRERDEEEKERALERARESPDLDALRARKLEAESRIAEAEADLTEGKHVLAEDVEDRVSRVVLAIREGILSAAPRAVQEGLVSAAHEEKLAAIMRDICSELARIQP